MFDSGLFYPQRNFGGLPPEYSSPESSPVVILPVPYDGTVEWQAGTRNGPRAIIDASPNLELYDCELEKDVFKVGIATLPELKPDTSGPEAMTERVCQVVKGLAAAGKFVITLGGEHSVTLGVVRVLAEKHASFSVLQLDAHGDLRDAYLGTRYSYATVMRRVLELRPVVQVGTRSLSREEHEFLKTRPAGVRTFYAAGFKYDDTFRRELLGALGENVYITIDLDVFDPSVMPAVTSPEPGGLDWPQVTGILEAVCREKKIIGCDMVEFRPSGDTGACAFTAAKLLYRLIGYIFCR